MKTTYVELKRFTGLASAYLSTRPAENPLTYALRKVMRRCEIAVSPLQDEMADKRIELASVDEKKNVMFDERGHYKFTKEAMLWQAKLQREMDGRELEIEPHIISSAKIPADLPPGFDEAFDGFVLNRQEHQEHKGVLNSILDEQRVLCLAIEKLPSSTEATNLSVMASNVAGKLQQIVFPH